MNYINRYIGTVTISEYYEVRKLITPILKKFFLGLRGRGRGCRKEGRKQFFSTFYGREVRTNTYQGYLPLELSEKVGLYIRVEPTHQFINKNRKSGMEEPYKTVRFFDESFCPMVRDQIRTVLKKNGITLQRVEST